MNFSLSFLPEVEEDAITGFFWYEEKSKGLGEDFLRIFYARAKEILDNPFLYGKIYRDFRRCFMRRFPYVIYYLVDGRQVIIFGLFHGARDPG